MDNIVLIGMPGSGKSTVGVLLAKTLGYEFIDTDLLLQKREGALLQALLNERGLDAFLGAEEQALLSLSCHHAVIAPGGSCVCRSGGMEHLATLGTMVYLSLTLETLEKRIWNIASRGIALEPGQTLADLYAYRTPRYAQYAQVTVAADGQTLEQTVQAVLCALGERGLLPHRRNLKEGT